MPFVRSTYPFVWGVPQWPNRCGCGSHHKIKGTFPSELRAIVCDNVVQNSKAVDDIEEKLHGLLGFDHGDWPSLYPFHELVYGDK